MLIFKGVGIYRIISVIAVLGAFYCYNPFALYFQNDDLVHIPLSKEGIILQHNTFRPVCDISIILDYRLWGKQSWGYHLTNLLLHIINTFFVYRLAKLITIKYKLVADTTTIALITSILFFVYANHSEAVFWILGRSGLLGMFFFLPASIFYLKRDKKIYFILSIILSILAWTSYESTLVLPLLMTVISLVDVKSNRSTYKKELLFLLPVCLGFTVYILARFYFTHQIIGTYESGIFKYNWLQLLPGNFARLLARSWLPPAENSSVMIINFIALVISGLLFYFLTKQKAVKQTYFLLVLLWMISLTIYVSLGIDTKGTESERFIYLPSFFVCLLIAFMVMQTNSHFLRIPAYSGLLIIHFIILYSNMLHFEFAGKIVKNTFETINQLKNKKTLFIDSLPQKDKGALIFRSSFQEGVSWLKNQGTVDSIIVLSKKKNDLLYNKNFKIRFMNRNRGNDREFLQSLSKEDVYFKYSDSALLVY